jgi:uncharacterized membrane protein YfcA
MGATVGGYGTLIGAGGGFLLMPLLLVLFPRENIAALTSVSLMVVALNAFSGTAAYARRGRIDFRLALAVASVTVPMCMLGAALTRYIPRTAFEAVFGLVLLVMGVVLVARPASAVGGRHDDRPPAPWRLRTGLVLSGAVGWLAGVLGIGGSPPQVVVLTHVMRVSVLRAMPAVQFVVLLSALAAVAVHVVADGFAGSMATLAFLGAGALLGAQIGAALSERVSGSMLVRLLASALLFVAAGLLAKVVHHLWLS